MEEDFKTTLQMNLENINAADKAFRPKLTRNLRFELINDLDKHHFSDDKKQYLIHLISSSHDLSEVMQAL